MKKKVPYLIPIEVNFTPSQSENILLFRYNIIIKKGYHFPYHDFYCYCSLLLRHNKIEQIPNMIKDIIIKDGVIIPEVKYELIRFQKINKEYIDKEDLKFFTKTQGEKVDVRKEIIKKEISRTNLNGKILNKISYKNSDYYKRLLELTREFSDITLLDYFTPIVLTYERLIHIFVKHVEETKFGDGLFKNRTYFTYKDTEIWTLLKNIITNVDKKNIEEHFIENSVNRDLNRMELSKDYRRTSNNPIIFNNDKFVLRINKYGFITQFYQL